MSKVREFGGKVKSAGSKALDKYAKAYVDHPILVPAATYISMAAIQTAIVAYTGFKASGGPLFDKVTAPVYEDHLIGYKNVTDYTTHFYGKIWIYVPSGQHEEPVYESVKIGEKLVDQLNTSLWAGGVVGAATSPLSCTGIRKLNKKIVEGYEERREKLFRNVKSRIFGPREEP
jgi:hypothetical protein